MPVTFLFKQFLLCGPFPTANPCNRPVWEVVMEITFPYNPCVDAPAASGSERDWLYLNTGPLRRRLS